VGGTKKQGASDAHLSTSFMDTNHSNSMIPCLHVQKVELAKAIERRWRYKHTKRTFIVILILAPRINTDARPEATIKYLHKLQRGG